jgi:transglutaminase-like putative cysteine protease
MYNIRQFKPTLYVLLMLGITGFSLAAELPGLWIVASLTMFLNAWLVKTHRFVPMPRLLANIISLGSLAVVTFEVRAGDATPIITVGEYIVMLHLVKLFEQRSNRDYAQLLVISLLLMVAAAISTASLLFGIIFITYMFLSLYTCLLFHLKVETDQARLDYPLPVDQMNPATLEQDRRQLPSSMRRLTALISSVGIVAAVLVFLFFPRGPGSGMFNPVQRRASQALTGFTDEVSLNQVAQITRSEEVVARVLVYKSMPTGEEQRQTQPGTLLLRGSALDVYSGNNAGDRPPRLWYRSRNLDLQNEPKEVGPGMDASLSAQGTVDCHQVISLQPTGTNKLFAVAGPARVSTNKSLTLHFSRSDGVIETESALLQPIQYDVWSTGNLGSNVPPLSDDPDARSVIDPAVLAYARRPQVCGTDPTGKALADYPLAGDHSHDAEIAANFEQYLRSNFTYTLDLTDFGSIGNRDPIVAFLTDFKKGHCEYFAGAMTLMCQGLGIPARYIVGFRCGPEDFNQLGNYFVVRQSNAHAWCEVFTGQQWNTFDPTAAGGAGGGASTGVFTKAREFFDYLEFKWASNVVAYDVQNRRSLVDSISTEMYSPAGSGIQNISIGNSLADFHNWIAKPSVLGGVIFTMVLSILAATAYFLWERWRLRKRARRIGLEALPNPDKIRLLRQLGFYDDLIRILERHRMIRPRHLTPLEFTRTLAFLPTEVYDDIQGLTEIFYRIRYGGMLYAAHPEANISAVVSRIQTALEESNQPRIY